MQLPKEDKVTYDKIYLENQIAILMGGRLAEELVLKQQTTGASNDIERATDLARRMVCSWGMSRLGPLAFGENQQEMFLGRDIQSRRNVSESMAQKIDAEIHDIVERNYTRAQNIMKKNIDKLHLLSEALLEFETLDKEQVDNLFSGKMKVKAKPAAAKKAPKHDA
jgi:cell division protease FtsH